MSQELIYTSAPKGLKLGARGFCTVASTPGMAKNLADRLESLSGYRHLYPPGSPEAHLNPVNFSYLKFTLGGHSYYVLSRIADAGLDYTQRTNKLAHHIVLQPSELPSAGPAWLASQPGIFETTWTRDPELLPNNYRPIPQGRLSADVCSAWELAIGDAGWAGVLAEHFQKNGSDEAYLIYRSGTELLELFIEAQALLPPDQRWAATFSTYFTKLPPGIECRWRGVVEGSPEALRASRSPEKLVIDLIAAKSMASGGELVVVARNGQRAQERPDDKSDSTGTSPRADSLIDKRLANGWDSARHEAGGVASVGSRPPALPQRQHFRWVPTAIRKGLSHHERAMWVAVILMLLASMCGLTYYFSRWSLTPPTEPVASADASETPKATEVETEQASDSNSTNSNNSTKHITSETPSGPSPQRDSSKGIEPRREAVGQSKVQETSDTGPREQQLNSQPTVQPEPELVPLSVEVDQQFQATGLPKFNPGEIPTPWNTKQRVAIISEPMPGSLDLTLIEAHDDPEKLSITRRRPGIWGIVATNDSGTQRAIGTFELTHGALTFIGATSALHSGATALRDSVLSATTNHDRKSQLIPLFPTAHQEKPLEWNMDRLIKSGEWKISMAWPHSRSQEPITIPVGQDSVARVRLSLTDDDMLLRPDEQRTFTLGAPPVALVSIRYSLSSERQPSLRVTLHDPDGKTRFQEWREKIDRERTHRLKLAIEAYIKDSKFVPFWPSLSSDLQLPIDSESFLIDVRKKKSVNELRQLEQSIHARLTEYVQDLAPRGAKVPEVPRHPDLITHEGKYPNLYMMEDEIRDILKQSPINLEITRLIHSIDQRAEPFRIDIIVAGQL